MKVISIIENEDGSAKLELDLTLHEKELLIEHAIQDLLREYVNEHLTNQPNNREPL